MKFSFNSLGALSMILLILRPVFCYNNCDYCSTNTGCRAECDAFLTASGLTWAGCKAKCAADSNDCAIYYASGDHCYCANECDNIKYYANPANDLDDDYFDGDYFDQNGVKSVDFLVMEGYAFGVISTIIIFTLACGATWLCHNRKNKQYSKEAHHDILTDEEALINQM
eukprot:UN01221